MSDLHQGRIRDSMLLTGKRSRKRMIRDYHTPVISTVISGLAMCYFAASFFVGLWESGFSFGMPVFGAMVLALMASIYPVRFALCWMERRESERSERASLLSGSEIHRLESVIARSAKAKARLKDAIAASGPSHITYGFLLDIEDELIDLLREEDAGEREACNKAFVHRMSR